MTDAPETARLLGLEPHPEGGWFRRTWAAGDELETPSGRRPAATMILYYLAPGDASAWHVVSSHETWLWHGPGVIRLQLGGAGERPEPGELHTLGGDVSAGEQPQVHIPAGTWQRALTHDGPGALASCVVSPGFSFDDWRLEATDD